MKYIKLIPNTDRMKLTSVYRFGFIRLLQNTGGFSLVMYALLYSTYTILFTSHVQEQLAQVIYDDSQTLKPPKETDPDLVK